MQRFIRALFGLALLSAVATAICALGFAYEIWRFPGDDLAGAGWLLMGVYPFFGAVLTGGVACVFWAVERTAKL